MRGLFLPAAGDAREKSPAEETRKTEDNGGMSDFILDCDLTYLISIRFNVIKVLRRDTNQHLLAFGQSRNLM